MNNQPAVYMSQEQINALFMRDSSYDVREERINSLQNDPQKKNEIWKTDGNEYEENRPTNQSESMMMITREEYVGLQAEYERRKDMEEKYKEDINKLMRELKQKSTEFESARRDQETLLEQNQRRESTVQTLRQQIQEANNREQKAILELANQYEEHLQIKQQHEIISQKYNNLLKQHKFEMDRKDKQIDQLKIQIFTLNEDNDKLRTQRQQSNEDRVNYLDSQRQSVDKLQNTNAWQSINASSYKSSIQFQKEKPIVQIQLKSNYDSKVIFGKKSPFGNQSQVYPPQQQQQQQEQQQYQQQQQQQQHQHQQMQQQSSQQNTSSSKQEQ